MYARKVLAALALFSLALAGCGDSPSGPGGGDGRVSLAFGVAGGALASRAAEGGGPLLQTGDGPLVVAGANGTLSITDVRLVVAEFEVDGDDDVNRCGTTGGGDDCEDFNAGPMFVDLPLTGGVVQVSTGDIPAGVYREVEFEIEDLDDDEEDPAERARIAALWQQIRAQFTDWPRDASMLVTGTFTPAGGGAPRAFRVFFEAEIEIEVGLNPPLTVTEGSADRQVSILLDVPAIFRTGGNVVDLSAMNGQLVEYESRLRTGFRGRSGSSDD